MERQLPHKYPSYRELSNIGGSPGTHHNSALGTLHVKNAASEPQIRNFLKTVSNSQVLADQLSIANSRIQNFELLKAYYKSRIDRQTPNLETLKIQDGKLGY
jgi:hypothetical protein